MSEIETPPLQQHPKVWDPATLVLLVILCVFGAIIGVQLLVSLGVTPNTAIIGAMAAMIVARVPLKFFGHYRSVHVQNLAQSATSAATFGAANSLLLPIAIPWLFGRPDMVVPMFIGVALAMLLDGFLLYKLFNTKLFPATGAWPHGVAAAERSGRQAGRPSRHRHFSWRLRILLQVPDGRSGYSLYRQCLGTRHAGHRLSPARLQQPGLWH